MKHILRKLSISSWLLTGLFLCIILSVGCSVVKNTTGQKSMQKNNINAKTEALNVSLKKENDSKSTQDLIHKVSSDKISIVCTTFPQYDWIRNILGKEKKRFDVTLLLDNGVDMHSYQPTVRDIAIIGSADLFVYVGGESDTWVADALKEAKNKNLKAINLMDVLGAYVKEEEVVEGMQEEKELLGHSHEEKTEYDEHIWLSIRNAEVLVKSIEQSVIQLDPDYKTVYLKNADNYIKKLNKLDKRYSNMIKNAKYKAILFGDRFPFRYLADDYHLRYYAAFVGCSAETMAGFETVTFLAKKIDELKLPVILTIENSDNRIAESIKTNTIKKNQQILAMNSLQSVTKEQLSNGITYLKIMKENLSVLSKALN